MSIRWYICPNCGNRVLAEYAMAHKRVCKAKERRIVVKEKPFEVKIEPFVEKIARQLERVLKVYVIFVPIGGSHLWL